jgi:hypothetical protein
MSKNFSQIRNATQAKNKQKLTKTNVTLYIEKMGRYYLNQIIQAHCSKSCQYYITFHVMWWKGHFNSLILFQKSIILD